MYSYIIVYIFAGNGIDKGKWGVWSESCDAGTAVCGISTKFMPPEYIDELAVTDLKLFCCPLD